jgi:hypothetical protein
MLILVVIGKARDALLPRYYSLSDSVSINRLNVNYVYLLVCLEGS